MSPTDDGPLRRRVVEAAWVPGRREPDQRSEMTTQWLFGEALGVVDVGDDGPWLRVRGPGGYVAWVHEGGLGGGSAPEVAAWEEAASARSLGVRLTPGGGRGASGGARVVPRYLPWGARLVPVDGDRVRLPGGGTAAFDPTDGVVDVPQRAERFPADGESVVDTALAWRGVPYLWGGRTREGADCSGFVQAVYAMHGVALPRDSGDQLAAGSGSAAVGREGPAGTGSPRQPGDLLFFGADPEEVTHVALVVEGTRVVHAAARNGSVAVDDLDGDRALERRLRERLAGATRPLAEA